jgi:hypothetical protein
MRRGCSLFLYQIQKRKLKEEAAGLCVINVRGARL